MGRYEIIDKGICPDCRNKMRSLDVNNGFDYFCDKCGVQYHFHDDPGPGAYSKVPFPRPKEE